MLKVMLNSDKIREIHKKGSKTMELLQLTYFCDAAETQNFSQTAKKYSVPPSNISQSIKRLEQELSAPLFIRSANRVVLSPRGRLFYDRVKEALALIEGAKAAVDSHAGPAELKICILVNRRIVMQAIERFQSRFSNVNILTTHDLSGEREADLIISDSDREMPGFVREKLFREDILLACRRDLLPGEGPLTAQLLRDKPFITMSPGNSLHGLTHKICRELGFQPRIALQSEDPFYIRKCLELGLGVAFVPSFSWRGQLSGEVLCRPVGDHSREISLYRRAGQAGFRHVEDFCRILREEIQQEQQI